MKIFFLTIVLLLLLAEAHADSFRCGRKLVKTGDSTGDLLRICGDPRSRDRGRERVKIDGVYRNTSVERWYYKKSRRSLEHVILIHGGRIAAIEVGGR